MNLETYEAQLAEVNQAISTILTEGQMYQIMGRMMSRANLGELRKLRKELEIEISRLKKGGIRLARVNRGYD